MQEKTIVESGQVDRHVDCAYTIHMYSEAATPGEGRQRIEAIDVDRALQRPTRPCARHMASIDSVVGCAFGCLFCPVRWRGLQSGVLKMKVDIPRLLERELDSRRRGGRIPDQVLFNPSSDAFQPSGPLLALAREVLGLLLEYDLTVRFKTRGQAPKEFGELFRAHPGKVHAEVSMFTMDPDLAALYEPGAATPQQRLETIRRLREWGVAVRARIEPLIPFISDTAAHLEDLVRHLRSAGVEKAVASYLVLQPRTLDQLKGTIPPAHFHLIKGNFKGLVWRKVGIHQTTKLLPARNREQGYKRLANIATKAGMDLTVCACQNPARGTPCYSPASAGAGNSQRTGKGQLDLFGCA